MRSKVGVTYEEPGTGLAQPPLTRHVTPFSLFRMPKCPKQNFPQSSLSLNFSLRIFFTYSSKWPKKARVCKLCLHLKKENDLYVRFKLMLSWSCILPTLRTARNRPDFETPLEHYFSMLVLWWLRPMFLLLW